MRRGAFSRQGQPKVLLLHLSLLGNTSLSFLLVDLLLCCSLGTRPGAVLAGRDEEECETSLLLCRLPYTAGVAPASLLMVGALQHISTSSACPTH